MLHNKATTVCEGTSKPRNGTFVGVCIQYRHIALKNVQCHCKHIEIVFSKCLLEWSTILWQLPPWIGNTLFYSDSYPLIWSLFICNIAIGSSKGGGQAGIVECIMSSEASSINRGLSKTPVHLKIMENQVDNMISQELSKSDIISQLTNSSSKY